MTVTSGLMLLAILKENPVPITVPVQPILDAHRRLMWVVTIIVTLPLLLMAPDSGTLTTPSGMGRTATLGATAVIMRDYHGFGRHSNKRPATILRFAGVPLLENVALVLRLNCWKFMFIN